MMQKALLLVISSVGPNHYSPINGNEVIQVKREINCHSEMGLVERLPGMFHLKANIVESQNKILLILPMLCL